MMFYMASKCLLVHSRFASIYAFVVLLCMSAAASSSSKTVLHNKISNDNEGYSLALLNMALAYHGDKYRLQSLPDSYSQAKQQEEIKFGGLSVMWAGTSRELEEEFRPIRIPLFKGLLGSRIFIIRHDQQHLFDNIQTLDDLKKVRLGQGATWADTAILKAAGLDVVTAQKYPNLFHMLEGGRFEAFPRGVHEPWSEVKDRKELNLAIEKGLMIVYRMPLYFFVEKGNLELAQDIEAGLESAIRDGAFDKLFFGNAMIKDVLKNANMDKRKVFYLANPYAHPQTPTERKELWYN